MQGPVVHGGRRGPLEGRPRRSVFKRLEFLTRWRVDSSAAGSVYCRWVTEKALGIVNIRNFALVLLRHSSPQLRYSGTGYSAEGK